MVEGGYRVRIAASAEEDLRTINAWLVDHKPELARHWRADVLAEIESLAECPGRCPRLKTPGRAAQSVRKLVLELDVVAFGIRDRTVIVMRVFHEGREPRLG